MIAGSKKPRARKVIGLADGVTEGPNGVHLIQFKERSDKGIVKVGRIFPHYEHVVIACTNLRGNFDLYSMTNAGNSGFLSFSPQFAEELLPYLQYVAEGRHRPSRRRKQSKKPSSKR